MIYQLETHIAQQLKDFFDNYDFIDKVVIFGSRAKHTANPKSDIDLCIYSLEMSDEQFSKLRFELDELPILYKLDIVHFEKVNRELQDNVEKDGKLLYQPKMKLKDIATYVNGKAFKPSEWSDNGLPIIRIQNLTNSKKEFNYYDKDIDEKYIIEFGDILISWSATLGVFEWKREISVLNQHIFKVVFDKNIKVDKKYFILAVQNILEHFERYVHGSTMKHITKKNFDNVELYFPTLTKQKNIAKVLDRANELITLRKESIEKLDDLSKSIFIDMFGDPVLNPKGWDKKPLKKIAKVQTGNTPSRKIKEYYGNYIEWIKSDNILKNKMYITKAKEYLSKEGLNKGRVADNNSLLMTCIAGSMKSIGNVAITKGQVSFNQQINAISLYEDNVLYLYYCLKMSKRYIEENSSKSMKIMINKTTLENLIFPLPSITLQNKFATIIEKIEEQKALYEQQLKLLEDNFNSLLQRSFS